MHLFFGMRGIGGGINLYSSCSSNPRVFDKSFWTELSPLPGLIILRGDYKEKSQLDTGIR